MPNEKPIPQQIPIEKIHDLPGVTDFKLPEKSYGTLVSSILVNGLREPVILRPQENGEYQLVHGYRRRKAAELAKLKTLDALVFDMTEKEAKDYRVAVAANPEAPIPGKLVEKPAESKAAPPKEEKPTEKKSDSVPAEKKADDKQPAKTAEPQEKKAEVAPPAQAKSSDEKPAEKKAEAAAPPAAKPEEKKPAEPPKPDKGAKADDQKEKKAAPAKAPAKEEEKPVGTAAVGPAGTTITKLLGEKLSPPTEKDKKALPVPGDGEAFSVVLHPAYLK